MELFNQDDSSLSLMDTCPCVQEASLSVPSSFRMLGCNYCRKSSLSRYLIQSIVCVRACVCVCVCVVRWLINISPVLNNKLQLCEMTHTKKSISPWTNPDVLILFIWSHPSPHPQQLRALRLFGMHGHIWAPELGGALQLNNNHLPFTGLWLFLMDGDGWLLTRLRLLLRAWPALTHST